MRADITTEGLTVLAAFTTDVKHWNLENGLQLNPNKSQVLIIRMPTQVQATTLTMSSMSVAGVDLPVSEEMKVLGVVLDCPLTFESYVTAKKCRVCNYHAQAIRHIQHLLMTELGLMLACCLILSQLDYCNAVLRAAPVNSI